MAMTSYIGEHVQIRRHRRGANASSPQVGDPQLDLEGSVTGQDTIGIEILRDADHAKYFIPWTSIDVLIVR